MRFIYKALIKKPRVSHRNGVCNKISIGIPGAVCASVDCEWGLQIIQETG